MDPFVRHIEPIEDGSVPLLRKRLNAMIQVGMSIWCKVLMHEFSEFQLPMHQLAHRMAMFVLFTTLSHLQTTAYA